MPCGFGFDTGSWRLSVSVKPTLAGAFLPLTSCTFKQPALHAGFPRVSCSPPVSNIWNRANKLENIPKNHEG